MQPETQSSKLRIREGSMYRNRDDLGLTVPLCVETSGLKSDVIIRYMDTHGY